MLRELSERTYFGLCRAAGALLRSARYSDVKIVRGEGDDSVRKQRRFYAPVLVRLGVPLVHVLNTGVRVLDQRDWVERERHVYRTLNRRRVRADSDGTLVLPHLPGVTLAKMLEDGRLDGGTRASAIRLAVAALVQLHRAGLTHGDAMAENVLIDAHAGVASWIDFETLHDERRPLTWRRADDVRALLATCVLRTPAAERTATLRLVLDTYGDAAILKPLATMFGSPLSRALPFHLGQAPLTFAGHREIGRLVVDLVERGSVHRKND